MSELFFQKLNIYFLKKLKPSRYKLYLTAFLFIPFCSFAYDISVCFTPGENCTQSIIHVIDQAKQTVFVQAYSFTSAPIAKALLEAKNRGVDVKIILDKSQFKSEKYSASKFLVNQGIPVWIDYKPSIAHNKVMVIDQATVITGSFNFTKAAQEKNAENLLVIHNPILAAQYLNNWYIRQEASKKFSDYHSKQFSANYILIH